MKRREAVGRAFAAERRAPSVRREKSFMFFLSLPATSGVYINQLRE